MDTRTFDKFRDVELTRSTTAQGLNKNKIYCLVNQIVFVLI